ncbi:hypothetical protein Cdeb_01808 [Caldibacillus debilis GB1]|uniref:Uncharacterized protein n=1 Tax=Caldibacillus debilis GB1 TaxID=1339248 RepID=A0A420VC69_9BACI|nr:hypothetical protein Cdeb_01808 [Caldibacillus debilis GB1]
MKSPILCATGFSSKEEEAVLPASFFPQRKESVSRVRRKQARLGEDGKKAAGRVSRGSGGADSRRLPGRTPLHEKEKDGESYRYRQAIGR